MACSITVNTYIRAPDSVTVPKKPHADRAPAGERRKSAQGLEERSGAGSTPVSVKISHTVETATFTPRTSSSPWTRRYPQLGFSRARRNTRARTGRTVRGRPGCFGLDACAIHGTPHTRFHG